MQRSPTTSRIAKLAVLICVILFGITLALTVASLCWTIRAEMVLSAALDPETGTFRLQTAYAAVGYARLSFGTLEVYAEDYHRVSLDRSRLIQNWLRHQASPWSVSLVRQSNGCW